MDGIASFLAGTSDASHSSPRRLSQDPGEWAGEITNLVAGMIPPEVPAHPSVHFNQQDEINGFAVGSVHLADGDGNVKGFIPLIVRRFSLKPLDIIVADGKFSPLTEKRLRELFSSSSMDEGTIDLWKVRDGSDQSMEDTNPSSAGLYPYAGAPMSREDFLQTLSPVDQVELKAILSKEASAMGLLNAMDKVALVHEFMTEPVEQIAPAPPVTVRSFVKVAAGKYQILTSEEGNFGPTVVETGEGGLRVAIKDAVPEQKDEWLTRVHRDGNATIKSQEEDSEENLAKEENINQGPRGGEVFLYRADRTAPEDGKDHCGCFAMTKGGQRIRGVLLPKVVDLAGKSINTKLFVGRHVAGVQPKIAIERISGTVDFKDEVEDAVPSQGETGTLVHVDEDGDTVALVPMTVDSIWTDGSLGGIFPGMDGEPSGPRMTLNARTMMGKKVELVVGKAKGIVDITPDHRKTESKKSERKRYAVSSEFKWVPMSEFKEFMDSPRVMRDAENLEKKAGITELRVIDTGLGYCFQAPWVKTAQEVLDKRAVAARPAIPAALGTNAASASAGQSSLPPKEAPARTAGPPTGMFHGAAAVDLSCLSEPEARHMLCELGANVATADGVLKAAHDLGSLRVRGLEDPIEKLAVGFLDVPSKAKMLRAALMGLGLGGAGVAAGGMGSGLGAMMEMAPEAVQRLEQQRGIRDQRHDLLRGGQALDDYSGGEFDRSGVDIGSPGSDEFYNSYKRSMDAADRHFDQIRKLGPAARASESSPFGDFFGKEGSVDERIEKLARHPFLAVPNKAKMLRAALGALGIGGIGLAGAGAASGQMARDEMAPETEQLRQQLRAEPMWEDRRYPRWQAPGGLVAERTGSVIPAEAWASAEEALQAAKGRGEDIAPLPPRGYGLIGRGINSVYQNAGTLLNGPAAMNTANSEMAALFDKRGSVDERALLDWGREKTNSANPAIEMVALLRHQAKDLFPKLAYLSRVQHTNDNPNFEKIGESGETIEAALDLNFLNPQNISYFIGLQPKLKEVLDGLGRMLVAVRLGLPDVDEETVRSAIKQIDSILSGLRALSFAETDG